MIQLLHRNDSEFIVVMTKEDAGKKRVTVRLDTLYNEGWQIKGKYFLNEYKN